MRNPLAFSAAGSDDLVAGPASMGAERPRLPSQFQVASMLTADTRAPPSHRGRGLGGGADKRYNDNNNDPAAAAAAVHVTPFQSSATTAFSAAAVDWPKPQQNTEHKLRRGVADEGMRSTNWIERARADARATKQHYDNETLLATVVASLAIAGGAMLVASIVLL